MGLQPAAEDMGLQSAAEIMGLQSAAEVMGLWGYSGVTVVIDWLPRWSYYRKGEEFWCYIGLHGYFLSFCTGNSKR